MSRVVRIRKRLELELELENRSGLISMESRTVQKQIIQKTQLNQLFQVNVIRLHLPRRHLLYVFSHNVDTQIFMVASVWRPNRVDIESSY